MKTKAKKDMKNVQYSIFLKVKKKTILFYFWANFERVVNARESC